MTPVLQLTDVTFRRDGKQIIDGISLTVHEGQHWALLGPNGAGKSTLLNFCAAVTFPSSGTVHVLGEQLLETIDTLDETHPEVASILVTHHLEELPTTTTHALLIAEGRTVASGPAREVVTTEHVSAAFSHPVEVRYDEGRWVARTKATRIDV